MSNDELIGAHELNVKAKPPPMPFKNVHSPSTIKNSNSEQHNKLKLRNIKLKSRRLKNNKPFSNCLMS